MSNVRTSSQKSRADAEHRSSGWNRPPPLPLAGRRWIETMEESGGDDDGRRKKEDQEEEAGDSKAGRLLPPNGECRCAAGADRCDASEALPLPAHGNGAIGEEPFPVGSLLSPCLACLGGSERLATVFSSSLSPSLAVSLLRATLSRSGSKGH
jgi:hypothetical protein